MTSSCGTENQEQADPVTRNLRDQYTHHVELQDEDEEDHPPESAVSVTDPTSLSTTGDAVPPCTPSAVTAPSTSLRLAPRPAHHRRSGTCWAAGGSRVGRSRASRGASSLPTCARLASAAGARRPWALGRRRVAGAGRAREALRDPPGSGLDLDAARARFAFAVPAFARRGAAGVDGRW